MGSDWTKCFDHTGRCIGHMRQNRNGRWVVKSDIRTKSFADWFEAHCWMLTHRQGVKWQVKTFASHMYWTGNDWSEDRLAGQVFKREVTLRTAPIPFLIILGIAWSWSRSKPTTGKVPSMASPKISRKSTCRSYHGNQKQVDGNLRR